MFSECYIDEITKAVNMFSKYWNINIGSSLKLFFHGGYKVIISEEDLYYGGELLVDQMEKFLCMKAGAQNIFLNLDINNKKEVLLERLEKVFRIEDVKNCDLNELDNMKIIVRELFKNVKDDNAEVFKLFKLIKDNVNNLLKIKASKQLILELHSIFTKYFLEKKSAIKGKKESIGSAISKNDIKNTLTGIRMNEGTIFKLVDYNLKEKKFYYILNDRDKTFKTMNGEQKVKIELRGFKAKIPLKSFDLKRSINLGIPQDVSISFINADQMFIGENKVLIGEKVKLKKRQDKEGNGKAVGFIEK